MISEKGTTSCEHEFIDDVFEVFSGWEEKLIHVRYCIHCEYQPCCAPLARDSESMRAEEERRCQWTLDSSMQEKKDPKK